ncbi:hypothetical protein FMEXI_8747 [Fusarium mexicanum]|uniref:DUF6546 domain-containing protein n=1 Tax=Fusarium mexicanum TaxID=751941 RepID=A0A8H5MSN4_9HYPO|nr:hypothetical protein FMEXI_8747 [Fusarium mexicanum]
MANQAASGGLPQEVRRNILHAIVDQRNLRWSVLASVSKEWQSVIGTRNMAKLNLRPSCLEDFEQAVVRQRDLVRHIYLNVDLPEYSCRACKKINISQKNDRLMAKTVQKLLIILSTWKTTNNLALELNASSASDSKHWFKNFCFNDEHDAPYARDPVIPMEAMHRDWHDPKHGWENGVRTQPPPFIANDQLFRSIDLLHYIPGFNLEDIPKVNAVTRFMIRRQFRHRFRLGGFAHVLSKFSRLTDFVYEPWPGEYRFDYEFPSLGINFSCDTKNLAQRSLRLNELAVSFFFDAVKFFEVCEEDWTWDHLESLSLTSNLLFRNMQCIGNLLIAAAKLVLRMPNLTTMVLWNGRAGKACAFMYTRAEHYAHITWRGTWDLEISRQVVEAWEDVAKFHSVELRLRHERFHETIRSHGDAIFHLNLPCQVIEPTSLWQIRVEDAQGL